MKALKAKPKAQVISQFVAIKKRDKKNRPIVGVVPGSEAKLYWVVLRRVSPDLMTCECRLGLGKSGYIGCLGNTHQSRRKDVLCYHSRAFVEASIQDKGFELAWCDSYEDALQVNRIHKGRIIEVRSHQSQGRMWVIIYKSPKQLKLQF